METVKAPILKEIEENLRVEDVIWLASMGVVFEIVAGHLVSLYME